VSYPGEHKQHCRGQMRITTFGHYACEAHSNCSAHVFGHGHRAPCPDCRTKWNGHLHERAYEQRLENERLEESNQRPPSKGQ